MNEIMKIQFDLEDIKKACRHYVKDEVMGIRAYDYVLKPEIIRGANGSFKGVEVFVLQKVKTESKSQDGGQR